MESIFYPIHGNVAPPAEVQEAMAFIQHKVESYKGKFKADPNDVNWRLLVFPHNGEWLIASNYEDGHQSSVYRDGNWYFRDPWDGHDALVRDDGVFQAIARHWLSYYTRGIYPA
jgi:hypothetical protein